MTQDLKPSEQQSVGMEVAPAWISSACTRCGKCCLNEHYMMTLTASAEDVARWRREGRDDILRYVAKVGPGFYDLWIDDGIELSRCPFLRKDRGATTYRCSLYETRPEAWRGYPVSYGQMVADECEIIDVIQLSAEAIDRAQSTVECKKAGAE